MNLEGRWHRLDPVGLVDLLVLYHLANLEARSIRLALAGQWHLLLQLDPLGLLDPVNLVALVGQ